MDPKIETLRALADRAAAIQEAADRTGRDLSSAEENEINAIMTDFENTHEQISARNYRAGRKTEPGPTLNAGGIPGMPGRRFDPTRQGSLTGRRAVDLFGAAPAAQPGRLPFATLGDAVSVALRDPADPRLRVMGAASGMNESGDAGDGGWLIPIEWSYQLLDESLAFEAIRPLANVVPMNSNTLSLPRWDDFDRTGGKTAGLQLRWVDEGGQLAPQKGKVLPMLFKAHKAGLLVPVTSEMMEDAPAFGRQLQTKLVEAVSRGLDATFIQGTGAGTPLGILRSPALITIAKETAPAQANGTIVEQNVVKMQAAVHPQLWREAVWLASPSVVPQLLTLAQVAGPFGDSVRTASLVITQTADGELRLLGRRVLLTDGCPLLGQVGDLILAALPRYTIALRRDVRIETSLHLYFDTDQLAIRLTMRLDGQPEWQTPVTYADGVTKASCFVALAAR